MVGFDEDIVPIFQGYFREQMLKHGIATPDGVFILDLIDYDSVKYFNERITIALHGYEEGRESAHPMPPGGPLPDEDLKTWDDWVAGGMIKTKAPAV